MCAQLKAEGQSTAGPACQGQGLGATSQTTTTQTVPTTTPTLGFTLGARATVYGTVIAGQAPDATLSIAATKVNPLPASAFYVHPSQPAYGGFLTIDNTSSAFSDDLETDVTLLSANGQTSNGPGIATPNSGPCAQNANVQSLNLPPGQTAHVCVIAEAPAGAKATSVRFTPDGGLSSDYAEWQLH